MRTICELGFGSGVVAVCMSMSHPSYGQFKTAILELVEAKRVSAYAFTLRSEGLLGSNWEIFGNYDELLAICKWFGSDAVDEFNKYNCSPKWSVEGF